MDVSSAKYHAGSTGGGGSDYQNTSGPATDAAGRTAHKAGGSISGFFSSLFGSDDDTNNTASLRPKMPTSHANQNTTTGTDGLKAEIIEENLPVGKRVEQTGGVHLREEHVVVNRILAIRPASEADFQAFKEGPVEVTELAERAVVAKEAHVVEEVSLGREVAEREQVIGDTEVDVEQLPGSTTTTTSTSGTKSAPSE